MKKNFKLVLALVLSIMMVLGSMSAMAEGPEYKITVTPSGSGVSIDGKTFYAFKLFDATYSGEAVAYSIKTDSYFYSNAAVKGILDTYFTFTKTSDATVYTVTPKSGFDVAQAYALTEALNGKLPAESAADASAVAANDKAEIAVPSAGYYIVTGSGEAIDGEAGKKDVIAATAVTTAKPTAEIKAKIDAPSIDKEVDNPIDTAKHENQKSIGDTVSYDIKTKVPDMTGYTTSYYFIVTDKLSGGLTYKADTLSVKLNGAAPSQGYEVFYSLDGTTYGNAGVMPTDYDEGDELYIKIVFKKFIAYKGTYNNSTQTWDGSLEGKDILIEYDAILNDSAVLGATGNPNDVKLTYSNNPNHEGDGTTDQPGPGDAVGETPWHTVKTYTTGIELLKIDGTDTSKKLQNVVFNVTGEKVNDIKETTYERYVKVADGTGTHYLLKDGTFSTTEIQNDKTQDGYNGDKYAETTKNYKLETGVAFSKGETETVTYQAKTDANGLITLSGLSAGTYTFTEIETNDGYNLLENPVVITVGYNTNTTGEAPNQKVTFKEWTFKKDSGNVSTSVNANNRFEFTVENNKGATLPSTGGIGTTIFYVAGSIMVLAAAILLITKRRMGADE